MLPTCSPSVMHRPQGVEETILTSGSLSDPLSRTKHIDNHKYPIMCTLCPFANFTISATLLEYNIFSNHDNQVATAAVE